MNRKEFTATAKANGLTVKQMIKLSMMQSEVYHAIKFNGAEDSADLGLPLGDIQFNGTAMRPMRKLAELGFIKMDTYERSFQITPKGWSVSCNSGAAVFIGGADDADITDKPNVIEPVTRHDTQAFLFTVKDEQFTTYADTLMNAYEAANDWLWSLGGELNNNFYAWMEGRADNHMRATYGLWD